MIYVTEPDQVVKITFNSFDLEMPYNESCTHDYIEVRDFSYDGPLIGRYCGNVLPKPIITNANQVYVYFHSDENGSNSGFRLTFEVIPSPCGPSRLIASAEEKTLTSPNYPNAYLANLRCKWMISTNNTSYYSLNVIELTITDIDVPCGEDYLEIKTVRQVYRSMLNTVRYCGNNSTKVGHYRNGALITFSSDGVHNGGRGFSLTYKIENCSKTYTDNYGTIFSPGYPGRVHSSRQCLIHITAAAGRTIAVYFSQFAFMRFEDCSHDYMKIYDGNSETSPLLANDCGIVPPNPVFSSSNELFIQINMRNLYGLYLMTYLTTDKGRGCGGSITSARGAVTSPLYPQPYNQTAECLWFISVPGYHTVNLDISHFALKSTPNCSANYLEIYEGSAPVISNKIVRFCGQDVPSTRHQFRSNEVVLKLVTDTTNDQSGFYISFSSSEHVPEDAATNFVQKYDNAK